MGGTCSIHAKDGDSLARQNHTLTLSSRYIFKRFHEIAASASWLPQTVRAPIRLYSIGFHWTPLWHLILQIFIKIDRENTNLVRNGEKIGHLV